MPIGNLTSQWFANWYLYELDHTITSHWGIGGCVRYCDDFLLLDNDRGKLEMAAGAITTWLASRRLACTRTGWQSWTLPPDVYLSGFAPGEATGRLAHRTCGPSGAGCAGCGVNVPPGGSRGRTWRRDCKAGWGMPGRRTVSGWYAACPRCGSGALPVRGHQHRSRKAAI